MLYNDHIKNNNNNNNNNYSSNLTGNNSNSDDNSTTNNSYVTCNLCYKQLLVEVHIPFSLR